MVSERRKRITPSRFKVRYVIVGVVVVALLALFLAVARAQEYRTVEKFTDADDLFDVVSDNLEQHGVRIVPELRYTIDSEEGLAEVATSIVRSSFFINIPSSQQEFVLSSYQSGRIEIDSEAEEVLVQRYVDALEVGDSIYNVKVFSGNNEFFTEVAVSSDGSPKAGAFFDASRLHANVRTVEQIEKRYRAERLEVITRYLWGSPAETVYGKVSALCSRESCSQCQLVEEQGKAGPIFASIQTSPKAVSDGTISGSCCLAAVQYSYETGFSKLVAGEGSIEGILGSAASGSMGLEVCAD